MAQGALAWIWARSPLTVPLPGFRDSTQVRTLIEAQRCGYHRVEAERRPSLRSYDDGDLVFVATIGG